MNFTLHTSSSFSRHSFASILAISDCNQLWPLSVLFLCFVRLFMFGFVLISIRFILEKPVLQHAMPCNTTPHNTENRGDRFYSKHVYIFFIYLFCCCSFYVCFIRWPLNCLFVSFEQFFNRGSFVRAHKQTKNNILMNLIYKLVYLMTVARQNVALLIIVIMIAG